MTPNITRIEPPAMAALAGGAAGITAINTIKSITKINVDNLEPDPSVGGKTSISGYSGRAVKPIAIRFVHNIASIPNVKVPICGVGGIYTWQDALEFILMGASTLQIVTAVMEYGYRIIDDLVDGLSRYMDGLAIQSLDSLVGKGINSVVKPSELDRKTIRRPLFDYQECVGCGRCFISCNDAGHQALQWQSNERKPLLLNDKCVGCHLCANVCPVSAIKTM